MSILIKGIPLAGYEISIMKDGERYRARVDGIWCEVEEIPTTEPDMDTISRQAVKEILDKNQMPYHVYPYVWDAINALPPAEPGRIKGHWVDAVIPNDSGGLPVIVCDKCNTFFPLQFGDSHNFCPNCGAKMEVT